MIILGIETSCDETAVSIVEANGDLENLNFKVLGSSINSQIQIHNEFGGIVPNLAKREHEKNLPAVLKQALEQAGLGENLKDIDLIAVTVGPGLEPALWTGITFAKELGEKWNIPVIPANHLEGHITSVLFNQKKKVEFSILALLISGGHTELTLLKSWTEKEKLGETLDDAVGEAFDKVARMLGLPYPGGPEISKLAEEARGKNIKLEKEFPRPMIHSKDFNFSFSGLKTAVLYYLRDKKDINKMAVAREFEDAVIETLISKTQKAIEEYLPKTLIIGGGVIANKALRENFLKLSEKYQELEILIPEKSLTTDNATMITASAYIEYLGNQKSDYGELKAQGNLNLS
ncbi:MAG: tRNA (adenosine(37)-N6)-threonylcarbamoyltransferase complex transferase subunit TsaD [Patescibacteria group bacterium]